MTPSQFSNLKAKLYADASLADLSDADASAALSVATYVPRPGLVTLVTLGSLLGAQAAAGLRAALLMASASADAATAAAAGYALDALRVGIDPSDPQAQAFAATLVGLNIGITAELARDALNIATYPQGGPATADEVKLARASTAAELLTSQLEAQVIDKLTTARQRLEVYRQAVNAGETVAAPTFESIIAA